MDTKEYRFTDKSTWGEGAWQSEPDKVQWQDKVTGFPCLAVRGPHGGWCGYVGVSEGHSMFSVDYSSCPIGCEDYACDHRPESVLEAHGGITFSDFCQEDHEQGICHIPGEGEPYRVWWLGFDCAHAGDYTPAFSDYRGMRSYEEYRTLAYVQQQCRVLAEQLASL